MAGLKKRSRDEADEEPRQTKTMGKKQKNATTAAAASQDDTPTWDLGNKRRLTISTFNSRVLVSIREYYEKDGAMLPSKKGISLSTEQWETILDAVNDVNAALRAQGVTLKGDNDGPASSDEAMDTDSDVQPLKTTEQAKSKLKTAAENTRSGSALTKSSSKKKANIEATSDEDEGASTVESDDS